MSRKKFGSGPLKARIPRDPLQPSSSVVSLRGGAGISRATKARKEPKKKTATKTATKTSKKTPRSKGIVTKTAVKSNTNLPIPLVKRRARPGYAVLKEIRKLQASIAFLIPAASFQQFVREIAQNYKSDLRFQSSVIKAL
ncbi:hypothetical protein IFR05_015388 [Cadophora sp. M221]|nr:hypothetical protein IFR05_015388 [Cadophora sp. M221]